MHAAAQQELGELQSAGTVPQRDVVVDVRANGAATLEIGYFVSAAGTGSSFFRSGCTVNLSPFRV